jgi:hypothetical protein
MPRRDGLAIALLAIALLAFPGEGDAGPGDATADRQRFAAATERLGAGDHAGAVADLIALAEVTGDGDLAADALFTAAGVREQRLADPVGALVLYRRIVRDHPQSRVAAAAARLAEQLGDDVGARGEGGDRAAAFARILADVGTRPEPVLLAEAAALTAVDWPGAPRVALWIADVHRRAGRTGPAIAAYRAVAARWPGSEHEVQAWRSAADAAIAGRDGDAAAAFARRLPAVTERDRVMKAGLLEAARKARTRALAYVAAWAALAAATAGLLLSLGLAVRSRRPGWRVAAPAVEVWYMAPVAGLLAAASLTANLTVAPAVLAMCGGGLALTWLSGAGLAAAAPASRGRIVVHVALCAVAAAALAAVAVLRGGLVEIIFETVRFGPDL